MEISLAAREVLARASVGSTTVMLPEQLDRDLYTEVNEVLARLGGKWQRKAKGHVFATDPSDDLRLVIATGLMPPRNPKNPLAFFPTPRQIVDRMLCDAAFGLCQIDLESILRPRLLEPSAGRGAIAFPLREYAQARNQEATVKCCELDQTFAAFLRAEGLPVVAEDFLAYEPVEGYHAILMNPPFSVAGGDRLAYIAHIEHAWEMLLPGGKLVAVAPPGFSFRKDQRARQFLALVEEYGMWEPLLDEAFAEAGTKVQTVLLCLHKPADWQQDTTSSSGARSCPEQSSASQLCLSQVAAQAPEPVHPVTVPAEGPVVLPQDTQATTQVAGLLLRRLGMSALPAHERRVIALDHLIVPGAELLHRSTQQLAKSVALVGVLQPPIVCLVQGSDLYDPDATFEVVAGRRRVLAAGLAGLTAIICEVYEASTPHFASLVTLIENEQRSSAWVKEVQALRQLMDEKVGLTMDDLASFGFARQSLAERIKIAQLPAVLVEQVLAGGMPHETARRLTRLSRAQQERLAALAQTGETITSELVVETLREQINAGFVPVQASLAQAGPGEAPTVPAPSETDLASASQALADLVADLHHFAHSGAYHAVPQAVRSLTTALIQQVQVCLKQLNTQKE